jgi:DNA-binding transcriptional regulator YiaG
MKKKTKVLSIFDKKMKDPKVKKAYKKIAKENFDSLPEPKHKHGYSGDEIREICEKRNINLDDFWIAFGVNTVCLAKDGRPRYYVCDVEKALWELKKPGGKFHPWD